jgi:hypothetical protein
MTHPIADQDIIAQYDHVAEPFFADVLQMDYGCYFLTDESTLSDFSLACLPEDASTEALSYRDAVSLGDSQLKSRIRERFGIEVERTTIRLVDLFVRIAEVSRPALLH